MTPRLTIDKGDTAAWIEYFSSGIKYSLQSAIAKAGNTLSTLRVNQRPSKREQEVLKIIKSLRFMLFASPA